MKNYVVWFDIPVTDLDRATQFYASVLETTIERTVPGMQMGVFAHSGEGVAGCLYQNADSQPAAHGPLLYFDVDGRLDSAIAQVEANHGKIVEPKQAIGPYGFRAIVLDSEGNRIALHSHTE